VEAVNTLDALLVGGRALVKRAHEAVLAREVGLGRRLCGLTGRDAPRRQRLLVVLVVKIAWPPLLPRRPLRVRQPVGRTAQSMVPLPGGWQPSTVFSNAGEPVPDTFKSSTHRKGGHNAPRLNAQWRDESGAHCRSERPDMGRSCPLGRRLGAPSRRPRGVSASGLSSSST
jgi:hypothetical protein